MSYEPHIIIKKADLDKHSELFDSDWLWKETEEELQKGEDGETVMEYLRGVQKLKPFSIDGVEMVLCAPCFSSFNKLVRDKLTKLKVQFTVDY